MIFVCMQNKFNMFRHTNNCYHVDCKLISLFAKTETITVGKMIVARFKYVRRFFYCDVIYIIFVTLLNEQSTNLQNRYILQNTYSKFIFGVSSRHICICFCKYAFISYVLLSIIWKRGLNFYINYLEMHFAVPKIIHSVGHLYLHFTSRCIPNLQTIAKSGFSRKKWNLIFRQFCRFK